MSSAAPTPTVGTLSRRACLGQNCQWVDPFAPDAPKRDTRNAAAHATDTLQWHRSPAAMSRSLHHEHLVRINDPRNLAGEWLTRAQLWAGLRYTIETPQVVDDSIDSADVVEVGPGILAREIRRGPRSTRDEVILVPNELLQIRADARGEFSGSTLTIAIEEPAPGMLFVRFTYEICGLAEGREAEEDTARRSAYQHSDVTRIREVRRYVAGKMRRLQ